LRTTCPSCKHQFDTAAAKAAPVQALNEMYARFGPTQHVAEEYMRLFGQCYKKETRLVTELLAIWDEEYFRIGKRGWAVSKDVITKSLTAVCNQMPVLKNGHGYLLAVLKSKAVADERIAEDTKHREALNRPRRAEQGMHKITGERLPEPTAEERAVLAEEIKRFNSKGKYGGNSGT